MIMMLTLPVLMDRSLLKLTANLLPGFKMIIAALQTFAILDSNLMSTELAKVANLSQGLKEKMVKHAAQIAVPIRKSFWRTVPARIAIHLPGPKEEAGNAAQASAPRDKNS